MAETSYKHCVTMIKTAITKITLVGFFPLMCSLAPALDTIALAQKLPESTSRVAPLMAQGDTNTPIKLVEQANSFREQNQLDRAIALYRQAIAASPEFVPAYYGLGVTLRQKGDIQGAIDAHRQAITIDKNYTPAYYGLGIALYQKGDANGAIEAYSQFIQLSKVGTNLAPVYYNLGLAYERRNNIEGAIAAFRKAIEFDPKYALAYNGLGTVLDGKAIAKKRSQPIVGRSSLLPNMLLLILRWEFPYMKKGTTLAQLSLING